MKRLLLHYELPVDVRLSDGEKLRCRACDVTVDSITLKSPYNADRGTPLDIHFQFLVGGKPREITTRAVVADAYLTGTDNLFHVQLRFESLPPQQREILEAFILERIHA